jgi:Zn-dependent protease
MQDIVFTLLVLIFSVILHEVAHGYMANWLGDPTARLQGRLTLNPLKHIDPIGSILLPAILALTHSPMLIGYAKPVPYNPYNLRGRYGETLVAAAGPGVNILLALLFGLSVRLFGAMMGQGMFEAFILITYINLVLALFNLVPIPPLDGSKVLSGILPEPLARGYDTFRVALERLGTLQGTLVLLLVFYYVLAPIFSPFVRGTLALLTGYSL